MRISCSWLVAQAALAAALPAPAQRRGLPPPSAAAAPARAAGDGAPEQIGEMIAQMAGAARANAGGIAELLGRLLEAEDVEDHLLRDRGVHTRLAATEWPRRGRGRLSGQDGSKCTRADRHELHAIMKEFQENGRKIATSDAEHFVNGNLTGNQTDAQVEVVEKETPPECDPKKFVTFLGVKWDLVGVCVSKMVGISLKCSDCYVDFLQKAAGTSMFDMGCTPRCLPLMGCNMTNPDKADRCLKLEVPCLECYKEKVPRLVNCIGLKLAADKALGIVTDGITSGRIRVNTMKDQSQFKTIVEEFLAAMTPGEEDAEN